jgi:pimeloyl-ACP methyl ester carboxylesterase
MSQPKNPDVLCRDFRLAGVYPNCAINLRNKSRAHPKDCSKTVLFIHGATYGSTSTFDYPTDGQSWMDVMASAHYDAWCLDLSGYGISDRPEVMSQAPESHPPLMTTDQAVTEVKIAVDFILADRGIQQVSLIGYSWGSAICGQYAGQSPSTVDRLILCGALWVNPNPKASAHPLSAYRLVTAEEAYDRWIQTLDPDLLDQIIDPDHAKKWCADVLRCDPEFDPDHQPHLRAPRGVQADYLHCAITGEDWYAPEAIQAPTLVVMGDLDIETTPEQGWQVFKRLEGAATRQYSVLGLGTHSMLLERNRLELFEVCDHFLNPGQSAGL